MNMQIYTLITTHRGGSVTVACAIIILLIMGVAALDGQSGQQAITIVSPPAGFVVVPGQIVTVVVSPSTGLTLKAVAASLSVGSNPVPVGSVVQTTAPPFQVGLPVPDSALGTASINVLAIDTNNQRYSASVGIQVGTQLLPQTLMLLVDSVDLETPAETRRMSARVTFTDGVSRDVTKSLDTSYAVGNPGVATVTGGIVQGVNYGRTTMTVSYRQLSQTIPVRIGIFEVFGDLTGDGAVDQNDLNILLKALNTPATGLGDPRDLNSDGRIDAVDARILTNLCSRSRCATK